MARTISVEETAVAHELVERARAAMSAIANYDQPTVDRLCRGSNSTAAAVPMSGLCRLRRGDGRKSKGGGSRQGCEYFRLRHSAPPPVRRVRNSSTI